jgi:hypothetical protein
VNLDLDDYKNYLKINNNFEKPFLYFFLKNKHDFLDITIKNKYLDESKDNDQDILEKKVLNILEKDNFTIDDY